MLSKSMNYNSWGNYPLVKPAKVLPIHWRHEPIAFAEMQEDILCYAQGKSYGDSCLNENGILLDTKSLNRFISLDNTTGLLRCEAGITFAEILKVVVPKGWFLPVVPGTQFISLGGAIANDIHGKNHHRAGTFGRYVTCFELLRSDDTKIFCSSNQNVPLFNATIGGLGLTGVITWAEIQLIPITTPFLEVELIKFKNIEEFYELNETSEKVCTYTVAWLDCAAKGKSLGRGIYMRANHSEQTISNYLPKTSFSIPCFLPNFTLNRFSIKAFNWLYYHKQTSSTTTKLLHYQSFFFQLDALHHWNRIYGKRGFFQYQCLIPKKNKSAIKDLLKQISTSGQGSFLSVLKTFGPLTSPGILSFPCEGTTLALDFPNLGKKTFSLLKKLDDIILQNDGKIYPAKDARMPSSNFKQYFTNWAEFLKYKDPKFNSNFWRRVME